MITTAESGIKTIADQTNESESSMNLLNTLDKLVDKAEDYLEHGLRSIESNIASGLQNIIVSDNPEPTINVL